MNGSLLAFRHFETADGFALTLIGILFFVLGGIVVVARLIWKRQQDLAEQIRILREIAEEAPESPPFLDTRQKTAVPWERDGDWWKNA